MMTDNDRLEDITAGDSREHKLQSVSSEASPDSENEVFDRIANKLLRSGLILTALELHAELIERGKELPRLREFFDNPHNFEKQTESKQELNVPMMKNTRSPSDHTFDDSTDFTNYSDNDRPGDERVAILEFELRKAQNTIEKLRASLTMSTTTLQDGRFDGSELLNAKSLNHADGASMLQQHCGALSSTLVASLTDSFSDDRGSADGHSCPGEDDLKQTTTSATTKSTLVQSSDATVVNVFDAVDGGAFRTSTKSSLSTIKPHELRSINYLVQEYLLANNYKITSITFCDENVDQDFDNWEDVGLNTGRPPDLLRLYRFWWQNCSSLLRTSSNATTVMSNTSSSTITTTTLGGGSKINTTASNFLSDHLTSTEAQSGCTG